jgi:hypothetical protein
VKFLLSLLAVLLAGWWLARAFDDRKDPKGPPARNPPERDVYGDAGLGREDD